MDIGKVIYNPQNALTRLIEKWKESLDKKGFAGAILMDLSKAFDTINHELMIAKLNAYGKLFKGELRSKFFFLEKCL